MTMLLDRAPSSTRGSAWQVSLRLALREIRGGLGGFIVFIACIALGVMSIAAVGSFSRGLTEGLAREGQSILGGDIAFSLIQREASPAERDFLNAQGALSTMATMRAMARTESASALVELKAVDSAYPLYGAVGLDPVATIASALAPEGEIYGAVADPDLLARLGLTTGARITLGDAKLEIRAALRGEPDRLSAGIGFGPRLLVNEAALRASGLLQPGSLVRWTYRLKVPSSASDSAGLEHLEETADERFPEAGWEVRSRENASPQLERNIERFAQFLTLVGLTSLLVGGVGVANAVKGYVDRKRDVIATMKSIGASGGRVVLIYSLQVMLLAMVGIALGLIGGAVTPLLVRSLLGSALPLPLDASLHVSQLALAAGYGLLIALTFALWPLGRAHDVPVSALFREQVESTRRWPRPRYLIATALAGCALIAVAVGSAFDKRMALIFISAAAAVLVGLRLVALGLMALARAIPRPSSTVLRIAINNIHRPGALTPTVVLSLGLGLALLVTVAQIDGNLQRQFTAALPERAPAFYFLDIRQDEAQRFEEFISAQTPGATLDRVPMLRGRIVAVNDTPAENLSPPAQVAWALQGDRGITYANKPPEGSRIVAGEWWPADYQGQPLVSLEKRIADGLGLSVGDRLTVNVLGRNIVAGVANLRTVDWQTLGINFVLVYSPNTFRGAPHTSIATLSYRTEPADGAEAKLVQQLAATFPAVTVVRVKEALQMAAGLIGSLVTAVRGASLVSIVSAILVLGGALGASHRHRVYDAVILKTLGATRARLLGAYSLEYAILGAATALFGILSGTLAAWYVVTELMRLPFTPMLAPALTAAGAAIVLTLAFGLLGTLTALSEKPARVLRNL
jgi:putative ABC transport system permease protein